jgi:hypothetical protein
MGPWIWMAHVLRTVDGSRSLFLCATGPSPEIAMCELLAKSADAARTCIGLNGYALPPSFSDGPSKASDDRNPSLSDSSLTVDVLDNDLSMSSGCESLSDDETVSVASGARAKKNKHKGGKERERKGDGKGSNVRLARSRSRSRSIARSASRSRSRSRSRSCSSSGSGSVDYEQNPPRAWVPPQVPSGFVARPGGAGNPPPPPGHTSWPPHMPGMPRMARGPLPQASAPSPMVPAMNSPNPQNLPLHDVLIRIHWVGRGYAQVMKRLVANQPTLRSAALAYVRRNPDSFSGAQPSDQHALKMPMGSPAGLCLLASLRSVSIAGEQIDLRHYQGDNLDALIPEALDARTVLPKFEIDVSVASPPPSRPAFAQRPTSTVVGRLLDD